LPSFLLTAFMKLGYLFHKLFVDAILNLLSKSNLVFDLVSKFGNLFSDVAIEVVWFVFDQLALFVDFYFNAIDIGLDLVH